MEKEKSGNGLVALVEALIFAVIILAIIGVFGLVNINGDEVGIIDGVEFNMSVSEMKKISGDKFEVFDETDMSGCRNYLYEAEYDGKQATLAYIMEKRLFGYRLSQFQINVLEAGREDFDRMKESLEGLYGGRNGFKSGEIKESEGEISTEITTDDVRIELALKNGYLSANIEEI